MLTMDVFNQDAFSALEMTMALEKVSYAPSYLSTLPGLYVPVPVRTTQVMIEERGNLPALIQTSPRGAPPNEKGGDKRKVRAFETDRIALKSRITADQLQNIRAFGTTNELQSLQLEIARRQQHMRQDFELTKEHYLMGLIQGKFVDADGTVIRDWADEWGQTMPTEINLDLDAASPASGVLRKALNKLRRDMLVALEGMGGANVAIHAICGDAFYDSLTNHPEVIQTYINQTAANALRQGHGMPFESFRYQEITFHNYRGTDSTVAGKQVAINTNKCRFFPLNAGIFQMAYSPAETFDFVNTPGQELYSWMVVDKDRNAWADTEMYSYPLPVCVMPKALFSARRA